jgi:NADH-quinone oxidoreductase subunit N
VWIPDVYQGSPFVTMGFFSVVTKVSPFFFLGRLVYSFFVPFFSFFVPFFYWVALFSIFVGSFGALYQFNFKRFLAYTSIAHGGFIFLGLFSDPFSFVFYLVVYGFASLGLFSSFFSLFQRNVSFRLRSLEDLRLLFFSYPHFSFLFSIHFLSMAGLPPFVGFFSKFYVLFCSLESGFYLTTFFALFMSVVSSFYYLKLLKILFFSGSSSAHSLLGPYPYFALCVSYLFAIFNVSFLLFPDLLLFPVAFFSIFLVFVVVNCFWCYTFLYTYIFLEHEKVS